MNKIAMLMALRGHVGDLLDVLDQLEQIPTATPELTREEIISEIESYGVVINRFHRNGLDDERLLLILQALQKLGTRFSELAKTCSLTPVSLTTKELTNKILNQSIDVRYDDTQNQQSTVDETIVPGTQILTLDRSAFTDSSGAKYRSDIAQRIIIHEFGHIFHNVINSTTYDDAMTYRRTVDGQDIMINIPPNTPTGVVAYIKTVGAKYYTVERDFQYPVEVVDYAEPLTTLNFNGAGTKMDQLYITDTNRFTDNARQEFLRGDITIESDERGEFVYVDHTGKYRNKSDRVMFIEASTYIAEHSDLTENLSQQEDGRLKTYFPNETRDIDPSPKEGFADTFAVYILEPDLLEGTTRGQVMDEFVRAEICKLLEASS